MLSPFPVLQLLMVASYVVQILMVTSHILQLLMVVSHILQLLMVASHVLQLLMVTSHVLQLLMVASPVFKAMFSGTFKEAQTSEVVLTGKKWKEIEWMLDYLYPNTPFELTGLC